MYPNTVYPLTKGISIVHGVSVEGDTYICVLADLVNISSLQFEFSVHGYNPNLL